VWMCVACGVCERCVCLTVTEHAYFPLGRLIWRSYLEADFIYIL